MELIKMPGVTYCEFKRNEYILRQGDKVDFLYYLVSGSVNRTTTTKKGDIIIFVVKDPNDSYNFVRSLLGVLVLYAKGITPYNFIARSRCYCYKIPKEVFFDYVKDKPDILNQIIYFAVSEISVISDFYTARQQRGVANQLCDFLLKSSIETDHKILVDKSYSNAVISQSLGIHKVTAARIIKALKEKGVIDRDKEGIIILNKEELLTYANSDKNLSYW